MGFGFQTPFLIHAFIFLAHFACKQKANNICLKLVA